MDIPRARKFIEADVEAFGEDWAAKGGEVSRPPSNRETRLA
jgi:hypothetical protein